MIMACATDLKIAYVVALKKFRRASSQAEREKVRCPKSRQSGTSSDFLAKRAIDAQDIFSQRLFFAPLFCFKKVEMKSLKQQ